MRSFSASLSQHIIREVLTSYKSLTCIMLFQLMDELVDPPGYCNSSRAGLQIRPLPYSQLNLCVNEHCLGSSKSGLDILILHVFCIQVNRFLFILLIRLNTICYFNIWYEIVSFNYKFAKVYEYLLNVVLLVSGIWMKIILHSDLFSVKSFNYFQWVFLCAVVLYCT